VPQLCKASLASQARLRPALPKPSPGLARELAKAGIEDLSEIKLLSPDWSALIGHNGHLNVHLMMREMNWWKGKPLLLAYKDRIANRPFLDLFSEICPTVILGDNVDSNVWRELASLTPFLSVSHQIFEFDDGRSMYWNDAGGLAVETWDAQDRGFPLRDIYDQRALSNPRLEETFHALRRQWGLGPTDWFVCLHMRDAATRGDTHGAGESIRNTSFDNYESAIRYITSQGGWVLRMGSPKVAPLPAMERVIDYARDPGQSPEMDIHLVRHARMFIGTTSGFAYVASSFGIPTAMVNAISSVGLLWSKDTRFALKPVHTREGRLLTQREVTSEKWRWTFPTFETLAHAGLQVSESSSDEILETVKEVLNLTNPTGNTPPLLSASEIQSWKAQVQVPGFYGSSLPSAYFLEKYRNSFLEQQ
jgi:putative glycosyltransferase (TIGR04372 family)